MNGSDDRLDQLLRAPLGPIADNGFSARVVAEIARAQERKSQRETLVLAIAAGILLLFLSAAGFSQWIARLGDSAANSLPLAMGAFAIAVTWAGLRVLAE